MSSLLSRGSKRKRAKRTGSGFAKNAKQSAARPDPSLAKNGRLGMTTKKALPQSRSYSSL
jgi:hypothetical protein